MADSAYPTDENIVGMEAWNTEFLSPLPTKTFADNPAVRDDPTVPVPDEDVARLPSSPQTKRFDKAAFVYDEKAVCGDESVFRHASFSASRP